MCHEVMWMLLELSRATNCILKLVDVNLTVQDYKSKGQESGYTLFEKLHTISNTQESTDILNINFGH